MSSRGPLRIPKLWAKGSGLKASLRLVKVFGIPIEVNISWIFIFILFTTALSLQLNQANFGWSAAHRWAVAASMVVLFFLSVLVHELSHSLVAVRNGIPVRRIVLFVFGGVSILARPTDRPLIEFTIAVVGPLSSMALAVVFGGLWYLLGAGNSTLEMLLVTLGWVNFTLASFNLLPGYPLDGGRLLLAGIWALTGRHRLATQVASRAGQAIGAIVVALAVPLALFLGVIDGIWMAVIGGFLFIAATGSLPASSPPEKSTGTGERRRRHEAEVEPERNLGWLKAHRIAEVALGHNRSMLSKELPLSSPLVSQGLARGDDVLIVHGDGEPEGVVTRSDLASVPFDARPDTRLAQVMAPISSFPWLTPENTLFELIERMETEGSQQVFIGRAGVLLGYVSRWDVMLHINKIRG